jgi:hypothetical protein
MTMHGWVEAEVRADAPIEKELCPKLKLKMQRSFEGPDVALNLGSSIISLH